MVNKDEYKHGTFHLVILLQYSHEFIGR